MNLHEQPQCLTAGDRFDSLDGAENADDVDGVTDLERRYPRHVSGCDRLVAVTQLGVVIADDASAAPCPCDLRACLPAQPGRVLAQLARVPPHLAGARDLMPGREHDAGTAGAS